MLKICSIASGSNGNAYYIESGGVAMLVDMGIAYRTFQSRCKSRGIDPKLIKYVFITHEHSDHVRGLPSLCRSTGARAYMTAGTARKCKPFYMPSERVVGIGCDSVTEVGPFRVTSFSKPHDVAEPCSFRIEAEGLSVGVFTDIGTRCPGLMENLSKCHVAFLESNYDEQMLWSGKYPEILKRRVASDFGHLSNEQAAQIVADADAKQLHTLLLSHLSADNNRPQIALKAFARFGDRYKVLTASRFEASELLTVTDKECIAPQRPIVIPERLDRAQHKLF